jgi:selenophosphate synthase (EC 2.7.9.3)
LVGLETSDDAGVYLMNSEQAIVQTVDFFTPVVDDPYAFGQIAAANALSDIYAMGAKPLTALNLVSFPVNKLDMEILGLILEGGMSKIREAGALLIGGHSIDDSEPKYGLSVTGIVHPDKVLSNKTACPGDYLVLTKPLGIGIITTGIKRGIVSLPDIEEATKVMTTLNQGACAAVLEVGVNACTDITGFGLLGHLHEMLFASGCSARVQSETVPVLNCAWDCIAQKAIPGGTLANRKFLEDKVQFNPEVPEAMQMVLADAITSGGLLLSVSENKLADLRSRLQMYDSPVIAVVGRVEEGKPGKITVSQD